MSTEATGDGKLDAVDQAQQVTAAGLGTRAGEISVADIETGPSPAGEAGVAGGADGPDGPVGPVGPGEDDGAEPDDDEDRAVNDGETEAGDAPTELIDFGEAAELEEPAAPRRRRRWSRVLIAAGFVIVAAAIVGGAVAIVGSVTHGFKKPVKVTYKKSAVFSLKTGDCFDPQGQSYKLVSCNAPHTAEVFATFALSGTTWPGNSAASAAASSGCATRLTGYLNPQLSVSLASTYVYPDATAWQAGTRTVICEVRAASGELTGSVRGAAATAG